MRRLIGEDVRYLCDSLASCFHCYNIRYLFRNVPRSVAAWRASWLRSPPERVIRPGRTLSNPVGVRYCRRRRRQRHPGAGLRREGRRRPSERTRPARRGVAWWICSAGENDATRPGFHVHVVWIASTNGARQTRQTKSTQNHRLGTPQFRVPIRRSVTTKGRPLN